METLHVDDSLHGTRLQDYLHRVWPDVDQRVLRHLIDAEAVEVNGLVAGARRRLNGGDLVQVQVEESVADLPKHRLRRKSAAVANIEVLVERDGLMVVAKPAGIPCMDDRAGKFPGVCGILQNREPECELRVIHRLDAETSGCLLLSKGLEASRTWQEAYANGGLREQYLALVEGRVRSAGFLIDRALGPDPRRPGRVTVATTGSKKARPAQTWVEIAEEYRGYTLLRLMPRTSRGHQLRVHLRSIGNPIVGDKEYGGRSPLLLSDFKQGYKIRSGVKESPLLERMFLHVEQVEVDFPGEDEAICVSAELPESLGLVCAKLRRFA